MKIGDRVTVRETGERGRLISTEQYNDMSGGNLSPSGWRWTRWVLFDQSSPNRPMVVGHMPGELVTSKEER